jgi:hypothetical protein
LWHVLIENRNGLVVDAELLQANGTAERDAALLMAERIEGSKRVTVAADKAYDTKEFVREIEACASRRTSRRTTNDGAAAPSTGRQRHRRPHHAATRIQSKSGQAETDRGSIRLVEDCGDAT